MGFITYLLLYSTFWYGCIRSVVNIQNISYYMIAVFALCCLGMIKKLGKNVMKVRISSTVMMLIMLAITIVYIITYLIYDDMDINYRNHFVILVIQTIPAMLMGCLVSKYSDLKDKIKRLAPFVGFIFSIVSLYVILFPQDTVHGLVDGNVFLNYQALSYMAAYGAGLIGYYVLQYKERTWHYVFSLRIVMWAMLFLIFLDFLVIITSGGRGGIVVYLAEALVFIRYLWKKSAGMINKFFKILFFFVTIIGGVIILNYFTSHYNAGFERILFTFQKGGSAGRAELYISALKSWGERIVVGHGIGSVFYILGTYGHNHFIDLLVETGMIGFVFGLYILIKVIKRLQMKIKMDSTELLWEMIFLQGFITGMFSGYYLEDIELFFIIGYILHTNIWGDYKSGISQLNAS